MYVCVCRAVTESEVRQAISLGATSLAELQDSLDISNSCGQCREAVQCLLDSVAAAKPGCPGKACPRYNESCRPTDGLFEKIFGENVTLDDVQADGRRKLTASAAQSMRRIEVFRDGAFSSTKLYP